MKLGDDAVGRYHLRGSLGQSSTGFVYKAFDLELERTVALKIVRADGPAGAAARLLAEAQALARLQHPNVIRVYDVGARGDELFLAMALIAGPTLEAWLAEAPRPWRAIRDVFLAAGRGLAAAHAAGIVHRDVGPTKIIVGPGRVVLVDFDLSEGAGTPLDDQA